MGDYRVGWIYIYVNEPLWIVILSVIVCILSIIGSLAIILAFAFVKELRSKARELLVHLSVMDLLYSTANLIGVWLPYHKHLTSSDSNSSQSAYNTYHALCKAQAFLAVYGTVGSVLWTLGFAVYLYYMIVSRDEAVTRRVVYVLYILCYSLPLYVTLWLLIKNGLGYSDSPLSGGGWCSVNDHDIDPLENFMTNGIWIWLGITVLIPLYLLIHIHISDEIKKHKSDPDYCVWVAMNNPVEVKAEIKLLFIPVVFIFLRVWDVIGCILFVYHHPVPHKHGDYYWLQFLTAIGDCGQGFCNFIIFFVFQPQLRQLLINGCHFCCTCGKASQRGRQLPSETDELVWSLNRAANVPPPRHTLYV